MTRRSRGEGSADHTTAWINKLHGRWGRGGGRTHPQRRRIDQHELERAFQLRLANGRRLPVATDGRAGALGELAIR